MRESLKTLSQWDKRHIWHPFTQQAEWNQREPIIIQSGRGIWLRDVKGRRLLDGNSSLWVNVWGHGEPALNRALKKQIDRISHSTFLGLTHKPAIRLARELVRIAPAGLSRVFYSDNGSTAAEVALKMAYQYWQLKGQRSKTKFISLKHGYHGDTLGAVSVGGIGLFHARFRDLLFGGYHIDTTKDDFENLFKKHHAEVAAVIVEPLVQGASGMLLQPKGFLKRLAQLCRHYDILLIADEVATGFGRTGTMFAVEQEKVKPDFLCVAKSLTAGYLPLAATLTTEKIYRAFLGHFDEFKAFFHGHTYTANPLACAVALENLRLYKERDLLRNVRARTKQLAQGLASLKDHPHVKEIRQIGLMVGIELVRDKKTGKGYPPGWRMGLMVCDTLLESGVWLRPLGDVLVLLPPLAISAKEMDFFSRKVRQAIDDVTTR
jgi:adenosylmethionine-8-amino-7-oxononanoate aminotransferase